jgi:hypothetical protein
VSRQDEGFSSVMFFILIDRDALRMGHPPRPAAFLRKIPPIDFARAGAK